MFAKNKVETTLFLALLWRLTISCKMCFNNTNEPSYVSSLSVVQKPTLSDITRGIHRLATIRHSKRERCNKASVSCCFFVVVVEEIDFYLILSFDLILIAVLNVTHVSHNQNARGKNTESGANQTAYSYFVFPLKQTDFQLLAPLTAEFTLCQEKLVFFFSSN